jgi:hypothetical protein
MAGEGRAGSAAEPARTPDDMTGVPAMPGRRYLEPAWRAPDGFAAIPATALDPPQRATSPAVPVLHGSGAPCETIPQLRGKSFPELSKFFPPGCFRTGPREPQRPVTCRLPIGTAYSPLPLLPMHSSMGRVVDLCAAVWPNSTPALTTVPKFRTNNPLERIIREIRRRTRVVAAFPNGQSCLNLAVARLRNIAGT